MNTHISDKRFESVREVNTPVDVSCLAKRYKTAVEWRKRAAELREQVLASAGLLPVPEKCPLNARVFGRIDRGDRDAGERCDVGPAGPTRPDGARLGPPWRTAAGGEIGRASCRERV